MSESGTGMIAHGVRSREGASRTQPVPLACRNPLTTAAALSAALPLAALFTSHQHDLSAHFLAHSRHLLRSSLLSSTMTTPQMDALAVNKKTLIYVGP